MANKSIIDVDINDQQFKEFYQLFQQFHEKLGDLPEEWDKINDAQQEAAAAFTAASAGVIESMLAASEHAKNIGQYLKEATDAQKEFGSASKVGQSNLSKMSKDARQLGESIFGIGKFLFKMGAIGIGAAAGGLFGIDRLGDSAVANQRSGRGLGMTSGEFRAFDTTLGRNIDQSTLSSVADAQNSYTGRMWLGRATGLNPQEVMNTDAGSLSGQLALKAHDWWAKTPEAQRTDANLMATGFTQSGFSMADMRREGNTPRSEIEHGIADYRVQSKALNQSDGTVNALYDFNEKLRLAGQHLETDLADKLSELNKNGALSSFITNLEKDAEILINGVFTDKNMKSMQEGLTTFATYLGSASFKGDVKGFVDDLGKLAKIIHDVANIGSSWTDPKPGSTEDSIDKAGDTVWNFLSKYGSKAASNAATFGNALIHPVNTAKSAFNSLSDLSDSKNLKQLNSLEGSYHLPSGLLGATSQVESSGMSSAVSPAGAVGAFQLMPDTARALGVTNRNNFGQSAVAAAKLYDQLFTRYKGDTHKALAAYNWNPKALDADIAKHGDQWERYAPKETQGQISKVLAAMSQYKQTINVVVTNKSGTNVAVSANAAAI